MRTRAGLPTLRYLGLAAALGAGAGVLAPVVIGFMLAAPTPEQWPTEGEVRLLVSWFVAPFSVTAVGVAVLLRRWISRTRNMPDALMVGGAAHVIGVGVLLVMLGTRLRILDGVELSTIEGPAAVEALTQGLLGAFLVAAFSAPMGVPVCAVIVYALRRWSGVTPDPPPPDPPNDARVAAPPASDPGSREAPRSAPR